MDHGDMLNDLYRIAADAKVPPYQALLRGKPVTVLEETALQARIQYGDAGPDDYTPWVLKRDLKPPAQAKAPKPPKAPAPPKLPPAIAPSVHSTLREFAAWCDEKGYRLYANIRQEGERQRVVDEYREWTGGEAMPDEAINDYIGTPGTWQRQWVLSTRYSEDMPCHIPIEEAGTIGKGGGQSHVMGPHGVRSKDGRTVNFSNPETIQEALGAGLRARRK